MAAIKPERRMELDLARGFAVLSMVLIHVLQMLALYPDVVNSSFGKVMVFFGGWPAAPIFLWLMGVGIAYSRRTCAAWLAKRGILLFCGGYLLNIVRWYIPVTLGTWLGLANPFYLILSMQDLLLEVDILQMAGLAMLILALLHWLKVPYCIYPILAVFVSIVSWGLLGWSSQHNWINILLFPVLSQSVIVYFPLVVWLVYPLLGVGFAAMLRQINDHNAFYKRCGITGGLGLMSCFLLIWLIPDWQMSMIGIGEPILYATHSTLGHIAISCFVLLWLAVWYFFGHQLPASLRVFLQSWSRGVTPFYVIHWVIIGWLVTLLGLNQASLGQTLLLMVFVTGLSSWLTKLYRGYMQARAGVSQALRV